MLITAAVFIVGVLVAAFTPSFPLLLVARIIIGLAVGSASTVVPLYIGEIVPPRVRGGLVSLNKQRSPGHPGPLPDRRRPLRLAGRCSVAATGRGACSWGC